MRKFVTLTALAVLGVAPLRAAQEAADSLSWPWNDSDVVVTNRVPPLGSQGLPILPRLSTNRVAVAQSRPAMLEPGVYESRPYTMIVVAPKPTRDESMVQPPGTVPRMPVQTPELHFVPLGVQREK